MVTYRRRPLFADPAVHIHLREAIQKARNNYPYWQDDFCVGGPPPGRWIIAARVYAPRGYAAPTRAEWMTSSKIKRRESSIWQRRFWEHRIRDEDDYRHHVDYLHYNPVKHGLVSSVGDWPYSTFHRYVQQGVYSADWGGGGIELAGRFGE